MAYRMCRISHRHNCHLIQQSAQSKKLSTDQVLVRYIGQKQATSVSDREYFLDTTAQLNLFLADVEKRAFRMARFAMGTDDQALDVVQDAMLEFVRRYRDKPEQEWPPLFYRVLQSKTTDAHRRRSVRQRFMGWLGLAADDDDSDPIQNAPDPRDASPLRLLEQAQLGGQLELAIATLPVRQQQAFLLRTWEGLDVAETAQAMGCSEGSVKTHYFRAVQALRLKLEEYRP